ncbi:hypothetical protein DMH25_08350 [Streptomyces sp. WAC 01325]|uniref:hypothetical protein n=1 Tax=Streptomyces sp. WAC 01325 TaxID=2203202 RepID=UPI000F8825F6|nr:hypothetical protein [Streptomyces sp. WAC 01325]RSN13788.1 hypothetical protein DMH25_08350 [Streptomyces sp. WAC 01325]
MLTARDLAKRHSAKSANQFGYLLAFTAGQEAAERGADTEVEVRRLDGPAEIAGYIEGLAAHRARTTKPAAPKPYRLDRRRKKTTQGEAR